ncbi:MAG: lipopolysaccharide transport periplasmic protein LptA [Betaproteobacteria bacterium]|jgi:lipopolysaccharide export system protein LptA|nr:lipopolysaccharide transport periplasmic protein LptA [Betaproteobacteria bacterium]
MRLRSTLLACAFLTCIAGAAGIASPAAAQKLNSNEPVNIEADRMKADDQKQVAEFEGRVVLTQGTFQLRADKLIVRKEDDGFQHATATGQPATFRQKREGTDEWIAGEAKRIEYDGRLEQVELFDGARVSRDNDEVRGNYISYDTRAQVFRVQGGKEIASTPGRDNRVRAVIQPRGKPADKDKSGAPLMLAPTPGIERRSK